MFISRRVLGSPLVCGGHTGVSRLHELAEEPSRKPPEETTRLVRLLIRQAERRARAEPEERSRLDGEEVLLDVQVDDVRCLLVASRRATLRQNVGLSPREQEIAEMVAAGYPNKTIAAALNISSWTVSTYLRRIFVKIGVHSRAAMVARLFEEGLIGDHAGRPEPHGRDA